ncbi:hypothetical protein ACX0HA_02355 [Flavobacterium hauense]
MAKLNRETLVNYFSSGQRPTGEAFKNLIESTVNILDDDFSEKPDAAIKVAGDGNEREVISFYRQSGEPSPDWTICVENNGDLVISRRQNEDQFKSSITFKDDGDIEINGRNTWISGGRRGEALEIVPADGKWHNIKENLTGINMFEVTAAYSAASGKHSTLIAWATHCFGKRRKIRRIRPRTFFFWTNKIRIRWVRVKDTNGHKTKCTLQIRTRYNCGKNSSIQCSVTQLWSNSQMPD